MTRYCSEGGEWKSLHTLLGSVLRSTYTQYTQIAWTSTIRTLFYIQHTKYSHKFKTERRVAYIFTEFLSFCAKMQFRK